MQSETKGGILPFPAAGHRLVIHYSRVAAVCQLIFIAAFSAFLVLVTVADKNVLAPLLLLPIGAFATSTFRRATTSQPALVIDANGVQITALSQVAIPWSDIREIRKIRRDALLIALDVDDPEPYTPPASTLRGKLLRFLSHLSYPPIAIYPREIIGRADDLVATIECYRAQAASESLSGR